MSTQRHPSQRVTPVEVGDPIRWADAQSGPLDLIGSCGSRHYLVGPLDDVWQAVQVVQVLSHGPGTRAHHRVLRHCQSLEAAQSACQDEEHRIAWRLLTETARDLLTHMDVVRQAVTA